MSTVFVAMSGGIDSSFAARLLKEQGHKVVGFTFLLLPKGMKDTDNPKACCSSTSVSRARKTARDLSIPHYIIDLRDEFERHVITRFTDEYRVGRTPNPCVLCNTFVKFSSFRDKAMALGADKIATGHYACIETTPEGPCLKKALDRTKDQSYFLYGIKKESLDSLLFPLASRTKADALKETNRRHTHYAGIRESQDICFIPEGDYRTFLRQFVPSKRGEIVSLEGQILGYHEGVHHYTVGQRRGLGIPFSAPLYVVSVDSASNTVVVGPREYLETTMLEASDINLFATPRDAKLTGKVRYRQKEQPCSCRIDGDRMFVRFEAPVSSITPGQSVVLYDGDTVVGGGTIEKALRNKVVTEKGANGEIANW
jgi:tRNA-uridine 2-sulfurtransferase